MNDTSWRIAVTVVDGASSVFEVDGAATSGNAGANLGTGFRLGGNATLASFTHVEVERTGYIPARVDSGTLAAIRAAPEA